MVNKRHQPRNQATDHATRTTTPDDTTGRRVLPDMHVREAPAHPPCFSTVDRCRCRCSVTPIGTFLARPFISFIPPRLEPPSGAHTPPAGSGQGTRRKWRARPTRASGATGGSGRSRRGAWGVTNRPLPRVRGSRPPCSTPGTVLRGGEAQKRRPPLSCDTSPCRWCSRSLRARLKIASARSSQTARSLLPRPSSAASLCRRGST